MAFLIAATLPAYSQTASKAPAAEAVAPAATPAPPAKAVEQAKVQPAEAAPPKPDTPADAAPAKKPTAQTTADSKPVAAAPAKPTEKPVEQAATAPSTQPTKRVVPMPVTKPAEAVAKADAKTKAAPQAKPETKEAKTDPASKPATETATATCPGHPGAIGTSRTITISPSEFQLIGHNDYKQSLPLADHEVVLTFDDGPIPPYTNSVLDTLAANCVKATYFLVGEMARLRPYLVRRIYNEGHSIGTHTQTHPIPFQRLSMKRVERQVDLGIVSVDNALGNPQALSPFFRIPGFGRTKAIDQFLVKKGLITWSTDVDTDDWKRGTSPSTLIKRTMKRLNAKGRGIILMHDIHADTALALPRLLKELKKAGYRIVHVVAAGKRPESLPQVVASKAEKEVWPRVLHAKAEKSGAAMSALRHRVKNARARRARRHHHHYRHHRRARAHTHTKTVSPVVAARERKFRPY